MKRRTFLKTAASVTGGLALGPNVVLSAEKPAAAAAADPAAGLPRRVLGRTGEKLSMVGFPGLSLMHYEQTECNDGIHKAFDHGVNYFDVAPAYGNGQCEIKMGIGLEGLDRSRYFLACKTKMREKDSAREELERSLARLKTDHFDLYQMHHLVQPEDVKRALGPGGAVETFLKAKEEGKVKYFGFSAHTTKAALEALKGFRFDSVMFPISFVEYYLRDFGKDVLALAHEQGAAVLAIKGMSLGPPPKGSKQTRKWWYNATEKEDDVNAALRFTWSRPNVVTAIPPSFLDLMHKAIDAAKVYRPPTETELAELKQRAQDCLSLFEREESQVACDGRRHPSHFANGHDGCPYGDFV